jgi:hypothetical protein
MRSRYIQWRCGFTNNHNVCGLAVIRLRTEIQRSAAPLLPSASRTPSNSVLMKKDRLPYRLDHDHKILRYCSPAVDVRNPGSFSLSDVDVHFLFFTSSITSTIVLSRFADLCRKVSRKTVCPGPDLQSSVLFILARRLQSSPRLSPHLIYNLLLSHRCWWCSKA